MRGGERAAGLGGRGGGREPILDACVHVLPCRGRPLPERALQPLVVVERQHGGLSGGARPSAKQHRFAVPFDLDRPSVARLHEEAATRRASTARRGIPVRDARDQLFWLVEERNRLLLASPRAGAHGGRRDTESSEREEIAARLHGWRTGQRALTGVAVASRPLRR